MTDVPAVPVLVRARKLPAAAPQVKVDVVPAARKSAALRFTTITETWAMLACVGWVEFVVVVVVVETEIRVVVTVAVTVEAGMTVLPESADDNCSSTIPRVDPQTTITITIAATGLLTPGLAPGTL